ncbi:hypothetical protein R3P38DRAFT_3182885 [Favolaschia claudopus]|uniref:F-box domain-containing protein n=1 Tax=Favolaschia claudopus TaxID=2862362 RepID=A0AAW0CBL8_9AGAR
MAAPLAVIDVWDTIISFVDPGLLRVAALVCRPLTAPAQRRLFHEIVIENRGEGESSPSQLLANALSTSPHLVKYIKRLDIDSSAPKCYSILSTIQWSHLHKIHLKNIGSVDPSVEGSIGLLLRSQSLQSLHLAVGAVETSKTQTEFLYRTVEACSATRIVSLVINDFHFVPGQHFIDLGGSQPKQRPTLLHLHLLRCSGIASLLRSTFDLSSLHKLGCCGDSWMPDFVELMRDAGELVEHVTVSPHDDSLKGINLSSLFPSLNTIIATRWPGTSV